MEGRHTKFDKDINMKQSVFPKPKHRKFKKPDKNSDSDTIKMNKKNKRDKRKDS